MAFGTNEQDGVSQISVLGPIDSGTRADLAALELALESKRVIIDFDGMSQITAVGCIEWSARIGGLLRGRLVEYHNCPIPFVDSCNLVPQMLGGSGVGSTVLVHSFYAPYTCRECGSDQEALIELTEVLDDLALPPRCCCRCGSPMSPGVEAEDYLAFIGRTM